MAGRATFVVLLCLFLPLECVVIFFYFGMQRVLRERSLCPFDQLIVQGTLLVFLWCL